MFQVPFFLPFPPALKYFLVAFNHSILPYGCCRITSDKIDDVLPVFSYYHFSSKPIFDVFLHSIWYFNVNNSKNAVLFGCSLSSPVSRHIQVIFIAWFYNIQSKTEKKILITMYFRLQSPYNVTGTRFKMNRTQCKLKRQESEK